MMVINWWLANHPLITQSKTSLDSLGFLAQGFWSLFYKLTLFDIPNRQLNLILRILEPKQSKAIATLLALYVLDAQAK